MTEFDVVNLGTLESHRQSNMARYIFNGCRTTLFTDGHKTKVNSELRQTKLAF